MKPIVTIPHTVLTTPAKTVTKFDAKLKELVREMEKTLKATRRPKGVGLAAPQVGEPYRLFITRPTAKSETRVFINPEIISLTNPETKDQKIGEDDKKLEGCLSIPDIWGHVNRAMMVTLRYQDIEGVSHEEILEGFLATIIQHQTDHTNGNLFTQRVVEHKGKFYKTSYDKDGKETLDEITF